MIQWGNLDNPQVRVVQAGKGKKPYYFCTLQWNVAQMQYDK